MAWTNAERATTFRAEYAYCLKVARDFFSKGMDHEAAYYIDWGLLYLNRAYLIEEGLENWSHDPHR